jgi:hypothetical protein
MRIMTIDKSVTWLRAAALSAALVALAAPAALADPPGYDFLDWAQLAPHPAPAAAPAPTTTRETARPPAAPSNCG